MTNRSRLALAALAVALVMPASAAATTKTVIAGPLKASKGMIGGSAVFMDHRDAR